MSAEVRGASNSLRERLLSKIVMPGPATPCATWVGAYNRQGLKRRNLYLCRPVIYSGGKGRRGGTVLYVGPTLLRLAGVNPARVDQTEACHTCPTGTPPDGMYRCVDLSHLSWGSRSENDGAHRQKGNKYEQ